MKQYFMKALTVIIILPLVLFVTIGLAFAADRRAGERTAPRAADKIQPNDADGFIHDDQPDGRPVKGQDQYRAPKEKVLCTVGVVGGLGSRDDFSNFFLYVPTSFIVKQLGISINPSMQFIRSSSLNYNRGSMLREIFNLKANGDILEAGLSVRLQYFFINPRTGTVSPYIAVGPGYNYRRYHYSIKSALSSTGKREFLHSFTANYGVGIYIHSGDRFRLSFDLSAVSYFNNAKAATAGFGYDTTGAMLGLGAHYLY